MDAPSLVTHKERQAIAEEIASKYLTFAAKISVSFSKGGILIEVFPDEILEIPHGRHTIVIKRED